jgi:hypothetical protein
VVQEYEDLPRGDGLAAMVGAASLVVWGIVVFTLGRYLWRAAGRRGWRDRLGRVLITAGHVLVGLARQEVINGMPVLLAAETPQAG